MNRIIVVFVILTSCSGEQLDYSWFENDWISDSEASIAINPNYAEIDAENIWILSDMFGKIRWIINGDTMRFLDTRYNQNAVWEAKFNVVPIDSESFKLEMPMDLKAFQMQLLSETRVIWKTDTGFCTVLSPEYLSEIGIEDSNTGLECFKPYVP